MTSVPEARRSRLGALTAAGVAAILALAASAAAGLPRHSDDAATFAGASTDVAVAGASDPYGLQTITALAEAVPEPPQVAKPADNKPVPVAASRSSVRRLMPVATAKDGACRLDLGYGIWKIDTTAARSLTMIAAVAYRKGLPVEKAGRAFQRSLHIEGRTPATPEFALKLITNEYKNKRPKTYAVDAVLALYRPHTLTCVHPAREMPYQELLTNGLTFRSQAMLFGVYDSYGVRPVGGFAPGGITTGHIEDSAHYDGRAVDVSFSPPNPANKQRGWLLAHWLVAHGDYHQVATVIFDDYIWSSWRAPEAWRKYVHPSGDTKNPTLRHLDHVHVDVVHGIPEDVPAAVPAAPAAPLHGTHATKSAKAGVKAPKAGVKAPKAGVKAPKAGVKPGGKRP